MRDKRDTGPRMNERIIAKSVQVIDQNGQNMGIMQTAAALEAARNSDMDLVEINATSTPVIAKIMDYGKFKYEQKKKASEAKKRQKGNELREVWVKPFIEENDLNIKMKKVFEFLGDGDKVKISIMTKRDKRILGQGRDVVPILFARITDIIGDKGILESKSKPDERTKSIIIAPTK